MIFSKKVNNCLQKIKTDFGKLRTGCTLVRILFCFRRSKPRPTGYGCFSLLLWEKGDRPAVDEESLASLTPHLGLCTKAGAKTPHPSLGYASRHLPPLGKAKEKCRFATYGMRGLRLTAESLKKVTLSLIDFHHHDGHIVGKL